jgi:hypothetical protein
MDTDDLTEMAYQTIAIAYDVSENLRAEIGASASGCSTEDDFLRATLALLDEVLEDPEAYLDSWNTLDGADVSKFSKGVHELRCHVVRALGAPIGKRGGRPFD